MASTTPPVPSTQDAHAKALAINLDPSIYGTIAEIGAGQEVARWFLTVGGASGTVAQTISAYDKTFSDATYGAGTRYVSKERLGAMLDHEYRLLTERLGPSRGESTRFFVFADTASARNYKGDNEQHAWVGLRFQAGPGASPSEVLLHVNLMDPTARRQQDALGLVGVNLIDAAFHHRSSPDDFLGAVWDGLSIDRLEIDVLEFGGAAFTGFGAGECCLRLLRRGMARAVLFDPSGRAVEPSGVLRKRALLVDRGRVAAAEPFRREMLEASGRQLRAEKVALERDPVALLEQSLHPVSGEPPDDAEVPALVGRMAGLGPVAVTDFAEGYLLAEYLRRYTAEPMRVVMGASLLARILAEQFYGDRPGGMLEGLGKLFATDIKVYAYPVPLEAVLAALGPGADGFRLAATGEGLVTADGIHPRPPVDHLYRYLREAGWVVPVGG